MVIDVYLCLYVVNRIYMCYGELIVIDFYCKYDLYLMLIFVDNLYDKLYILLF